MIKNQAFRFVLIGWGVVVLSGLTGCSRSEDPVILRVNGTDIPGSELNLLAATALASQGLTRGSLDGDLHLRKIAGNLYETLIDIYIIKQAAEVSLEVADEATIDAEVQKFKSGFESDEQYKQFLTDMNLTEEDARKIITDRERFLRYQRQVMEEGRPQLTDDQLKSYYYANQQVFRFPNMARISHLLFAVEKDATPEIWSRVKDRAEKVKREIDPGNPESFAQAARQYSQDIASAPNGGDLGFLPRNAEPQALIGAVFSARAGDIVGPIQTQDGCHLAVITEKEQSFADAYNEVKRLCETDSMTKHYQKWLNEKRSQATIERVIEPLDYFFPELKNM